MAGLPTGYLWQRGGIWYWAYKYENHTYSKSTFTGNRDQAEKILKEKMTCIRASIIDGSFKTKPSKITGYKPDQDLIAEALKRYLETDKGRNPGPATVKEYKFQYDRFWKWKHRHHPELLQRSDFTEDMARAFFRHLTDERLVAFGTYNKYRDLLSRIWAELDRTNPGAVNPFHNIARRKGNQHRRKDFTEEEVKLIIGSAKSWKKTLFLLGIYTGQRLGDNCMLRWDRVNLERNMVSVVPSKTRHSSGLEVDLPLHPELRAHLLKLKKTKSPYVMPEIAARYSSTKSRAMLVIEIQDFLRGLGFQVHKELEGEARRKAVVQYGFHSTRHYFISTCINAGVPAEVIRAIVGDSYRIYTHINPASKQRAIDVLPMMSKKTKPETDYSKLTEAELKKTLAQVQKALKQRQG